MHKPKIYLDTSVISHLSQEDVPDKMYDTLQLWEEIKQEHYKAYISETTVDEIMDAREPKRSIMLDFLEQIDYTILTIDENVREFAEKLNEKGILSVKHLDDCIHIGCAVVNSCNMIISWNFKHIVRVRTINGVRYISSMLGYGDVGIYPPSMIIKGDDFDE
jgi:predicted nucleic acid-binding protein